MIKLPAILWYPKDILASQRVALLDLKEEGAYRRALDFCWLHGSLPSNVKDLVKVIGKGCSIKIGEKVKSMFVIDPQDNSKLIHERHEAERTKQNNFKEKMSQSGKVGNEKRWRNNETKNNNSTVTHLSKSIDNNENGSLNYVDLAIKDVSPSDRLAIENVSQSDHLANEKNRFSFPITITDKYLNKYLFMIENARVENLEIFLEENFPMALETWKMKFGTEKFNELLEFFKTQHNQAIYNTTDEFRKHFSNFLTLKSSIIEKEKNSAKKENNYGKKHTNPGTSIIQSGRSFGSL